MENKEAMNQVVSNGNGYTQVKPYNVTSNISIILLVASLLLTINMHVGYIYSTGTSAILTFITYGFGLIHACDQASLGNYRAKVLRVIYIITAFIMLYSFYNYFSNMINDIPLTSFYHG